MSSPHDKAPDVSYDDSTGCQCDTCIDLRAARAENARLRSVLEQCWDKVRNRGTVEYEDLFDALQDRGLLVEVPSDEDFREDWGEDADTMYVLAWHPLATQPVPPTTQQESP